LGEWGSQEPQATQDDQQYYQPDWNRPQSASADIERRLNDIQSTMAAQQANADLVVVVKAVRGDADPRVVGDSVIQAWLDNEARADIGLQQLWLTRHENPAEF
jgi:hypothetical protein